MRTEKMVRAVFKLLSHRLEGVELSLLRKATQSSSALFNNSLPQAGGIASALDFLLN